jgi:thiosulfate dehydrogenase
MIYLEPAVGLRLLMNTLPKLAAAWLLTINLVAYAGEPAPTVVLTVPTAATLPSGALGESVARGRRYLSDTPVQLPAFVGNGLACQHCHPGRDGEVGTEANAAPFVGVVGRFPQYSARHAGLITLKQRIDDCFERSLNGRALPLDHPALIDILAYMSWLSQDVPVGAVVAGHGIPALTLERKPDVVHGEAIYQAKCLACHGTDGGGMLDADGRYLFPPLWGPRSFNAGAGMSRQTTAAGFIKHKMPFGADDSLSDAEAWDVAGFVLTHPRPFFQESTGD